MRTGSELLQEESTIKFIDGYEINGREDIANFILKCCEEYNKSYIKGGVVSIISGLALGGGIVGIGILINKKRKQKKLTIKNNEVQEEA